MDERRVDGPTPNGGAYSIIRFLDAQGESTDEAQATRFELVEYDVEGEGFHRSYGLMGAQAREEEASL